MFYSRPSIACVINDAFFKISAHFSKIDAQKTADFYASTAHFCHPTPKTTIVAEKYDCFSATINIRVKERFENLNKSVSFSCYSNSKSTIEYGSKVTDTLPLRTGSSLDTFMWEPSVIRHRHLPDAPGTLTRTFP